MKLKGIFAPISTPFDHSGNIYPAKIRHNMEKWNRTGLAGYAVGSVAGEGPLLTSSEKVRLWEMAAKHAGPGKLLIAAAGAESVRETVCLVNQATELGYQAALVRTPRYYRSLVNQPLFFRAVADQSRIPVVIDDQLSLGMETVTALAQHPNIVGLSARRVGEPLPPLEVLAAGGATLWKSFTAGASGALIDLANAIPYAIIALWEAFRTREEDAGKDWQTRILPAVRVTAKYGIPGLKYAMDLNGYYGGPPRLPLATPSPAARLEIEEAFRDLKG